MNQTIKITRKQAEKILRATFPTYSGRKISLEFAQKVWFYDTNWGGGTRNQYAGIKADGTVAKLNVPAPWINPIEGTSWELPADVLIVEHSIFCGQDMGIRIYAHPSNLPKWLPAEVS